jgi:signal transduction histidine kinase
MRTKLLFAQLPLVIGLAVTIIVGIVATRALGRGSQEILKDNYHSVLASQHMKEAVERVDSGVAFILEGRPTLGVDQIADNVGKFEEELRHQEDNITEPGEGEATNKLRALWTSYLAEVAEVRNNPEAAGLADRYFKSLLGKFLAVKDAADVVLVMNQDAMNNKSKRAGELASSANTLLVVVSIAALMLGILASSILTTRVLRPLSVLGQTARRLGEGDVGVRARVDSKDEIAEVAGELNTMAERIQKYRDSSLGDLLEAQLAAQATIDSLPDPVLVIGLDGELRQANQAAESILKVRAEAGMHALASLEPAVRSAVERVRQHVAGGRGAYLPKGLDEAVKAGERLLSPRGAPLYADEGDVVGATVVLQDVTRQHRFEELRNDLVATVAHELRTPLTSLRMAVHLLAEEIAGKLTAKQADLVFAAREDCDRLQSIVDELLDLSRIQADRIELRIADHDPEQLVHEVIVQQDGVAAAHEVRLRSEVLPGTPRVSVDHDRIQLVLANLIGNAVRYGPSGGTVAVRARVVDKQLRFEVADDGPGVPAEYREAIFDKYVRVPGAPAGGAGLGLFISREIARAHGGEIGVDSEPGRGATFWFTVPIA